METNQPNRTVVILLLIKIKLPSTCRKLRMIRHVDWEGVLRPEVATSVHRKWRTSACPVRDSDHLDWGQVALISICRSFPIITALMKWFRPHARTLTHTLTPYLFSHPVLIGWLLIVWLSNHPPHNWPNVINEAFMPDAR